MMGTWNLIGGNDVARDLEKEYRVAFIQYPVEEAVAVLDDYVAHRFGASSEDWLTYAISLALFVHKYGITIPSVIERGFNAVDEISTLYEKELTNSERKKLGQLRAKLQTPPSIRKKIRLNINAAPVFDVGDVLSLAVNFQRKPQYILLQKVGDLESWHSAIASEVRDIWPIFTLFDFCRDCLPTMGDFRRARRKQTFFSDGKMSVYQKRGVEMIGKASVKKPLTQCGDYLFFSVNPEAAIKKALNQ